MKNNLLEELPTFNEMSYLKIILILITHFSKEELTEFAFSKSWGDPA